MFRHEALIYVDPEEFVPKVGRFLNDGVDRGDAVLVVLSPDKTESLRQYLGDDAEGVEFLDVESVGRNPARLLSLWRDFDAESPGSTRGVGEPIRAGQTADEIVEAQLHEALLDHAFDLQTGLWLMCPYDASALDHGVVEEARIGHADGPMSSAAAEASRVWYTPLSTRGPATMLEFDAAAISPVRSETAHTALRHGMSRDRVEDLVLAVSEVATNSVLYGGGRGTAWIWVDLASRRLVVDIADQGKFIDPFVGRFLPNRIEVKGRGLWIANQLCDLVQLRNTAQGAVVRLQMHLDD